MNPFRPLITRATEAIKGRTYPRRVTAPNGNPRWQSRSGRSFPTPEEACGA